MKVCRLGMFNLTAVPLPREEIKQPLLFLISDWKSTRDQLAIHVPHQKHLSSFFFVHHIECEMWCENTLCSLFRIQTIYFRCAECDFSWSSASILSKYLNLYCFYFFFLDFNLDTFSLILVLPYNRRYHHSFFFRDFCSRLWVHTGIFLISVVFLFSCCCSLCL